MCLALPETIYPSSPPALHPSPQAVAQLEFPPTDGHQRNPVSLPLLNPDAPAFRFGAFEPASHSWSASQQSHSFASLPNDLRTVQHDAVYASCDQSQRYPAGVIPGAVNVGAQESDNGIRAENVAILHHSNPPMDLMATSGKGAAKGAGEPPQFSSTCTHHNSSLFIVDPRPSSGLL